MRGQMSFLEGLDTNNQIVNPPTDRQTDSYLFWKRKLRIVRIFSDWQVK